MTVCNIITYTWAISWGWNESWPETNEGIYDYEILPPVHANVCRWFSTLYVTQHTGTGCSNMSIPIFIALQCWKGGVQSFFNASIIQNWITHFRVTGPCMLWNYMGLKTICTPLRGPEEVLFIFLEYNWTVTFMWVSFMLRWHYFSCK